MIEAYENDFSRTALLDTIDGHYALPVKKLGDSLRGRGELKLSVRDLFDFGSTSGMDILAGVWFALDLEVRNMLAP